MLVSFQRGRGRRQKPRREQLSEQPLAWVLSFLCISSDRYVPARLKAPDTRRSRQNKNEGRSARVRWAGLVTGSNPPLKPTLQLSSTLGQLEREG